MLLIFRHLHLVWIYSLYKWILIFEVFFSSITWIIFLSPRPWIEIYTLNQQIALGRCYASKNYQSTKIMFKSFLFNLCQNWGKSIRLDTQWHAPCYNSCHKICHIFILEKYHPIISCHIHDEKLELNKWAFFLRINMTIHYNLKLLILYICTKIYKQNLLYFKKAYGLQRVKSLVNPTS